MHSRVNTWQLKSKRPLVPLLTSVPIEASYMKLHIFSHKNINFNLTAYVHCTYSGTVQVKPYIQIDIPFSPFNFLFLKICLPVI